MLYNTDNNNDGTLMDKYFSYETEHQLLYGKTNMVVLLQCGNFYELYAIYNITDDIFVNNNIEKCAQLCHLNIGNCINFKPPRNFDGKDINSVYKISRIGFILPMLDKYMNILISNNFTIVVYDQSDTIDINAKKDRYISGIYSPGTIANDIDTCGLTLSNNTCCIWLESYKRQNKINLTIGMANMDVYTTYTSISQCNELYVLNPTTFDKLENFISKINPRECIIISNLPNDELDMVVKYIHLDNDKVQLHLLSTHTDSTISSVLKKNIENAEKQTYQKHILTTFYDDALYDTHVREFEENYIGTAALCYLLSYIKDHNNKLLINLTPPNFEHYGNTVALANHSLKQLNILPNKEDSSHCILKLLNKCCTNMGKREFKHQLLSPSLDITWLNTEYDNINKIMENMDKMQNIRSMLLNVGDLERLLRSINALNITPSQLLHFYKYIALTKSIFNVCKESNNMDIGLPLDELDVNCNDIMTMITKNFNLDDPDMELQKELNSWTGNFIINNQSLDIINKEYYTLKEQLNNIIYFFNSLIRKKETDKTEYVKYVENDSGCFLTTTNNRCSLLQSKLKTYLSTSKNRFNKFSMENNNNNNNNNNNLINSIDELDIIKVSSKGTYSYIKHNTINTIIQQMKDNRQLQKETMKICYINIISQLQQHNEGIQSIFKNISYIDVLCSKTFVANKWKYCKPSIQLGEHIKSDNNNNDNNNTKKPYLRANDMRHPLIEQINEKELYVSNSIELGTKENTGMLLYGVNATGKTSLIKAIGICIIMAQAGMYVPCSSFIYQPYKHIYTRILGNDDIINGLSTFEVEMCELRAILKYSNSNSLVLGDELCSGTELYSAFSIFAAGIETLEKQKASFIFATHIHEIMDCEEIMKLDTVSVKHLSVTYNQELDTLTYNRKLCDGDGLRMYGLEVCKYLKLPDDFIKRSYHFRNKYYNTTNGQNSILNNNPSQYNAHKLKGGICSICKKNKATEIHHKQMQALADKDGYINNKETGQLFHKNHAANLLSICESCHLSIHS